MEFYDGAIRPIRFSLVYLICKNIKTLICFLGGVILDKRYQIFISSTYKDLIEERQKVTQAILKLYHFPIGMEMFHADNKEQWCQIKNTIDMRIIIF